MNVVPPRTRNANGFFIAASAYTLLTGKARSLSVSGCEAVGYVLGGTCLETGLCRCMGETMGRPKGSKNGVQSLVDNTCVICGCTFQTFPSRRREFCSVECWTVTRGGKISRTCVGCGKEFEAYESDIERRTDAGRYCSKECMSSSRIVQCKCKYCGKEYDIALSRSKSGRGMYCSKECASKGVHSEFLATCPKQTCATCGKEFVVSPYLHGRQKHCCRKCAKTGSANPQWIGGHTIEYPAAWTRKLRTAIKDRDGHKCAVCGDRATDVHHIDYNKDNCTPENLISLCHSCHAKTNVNRVRWQAFFLRLGTGQVDDAHVGEIADWVQRKAKGAR